MAGPGLVTLIATVRPDRIGNETIKSNSAATRSKAPSFASCLAPSRVRLFDVQQRETAHRPHVNPRPRDIGQGG